jgi:hypothetical protein
VIRRIVFSTVLLALTAAPAAQADFGFVPGSQSQSALNRNGTVALQAGSHPYSYTVRFNLKTDGNGQSEGGAMRDVLATLPAGFFGNPAAVPACPRQDFEGGQPNCPPSTQVGVARAIVPATGEAFGPLYNLEPPPGVTAQLGFSSAGLIILQSAVADPEDGYRVKVFAPNLPLEVTAVTETIWGVPADPGHTPERGPQTPFGIPSDAPLLPFLTLPTSCDTEPLLGLEVDSKLNPGVFIGGNEPVPMLEEGGNPTTFKGCESVPFEPTVTSAPTTTLGESPAGLGFTLQLPNKGLNNPKDEAITETEPTRTEVTLPAGVEINASAANGVAGCTLAQYKAETLTAQACPEAAKIGTLFAKTPLLEEPIEGSVYLATPRNNPFGSFLAIYIIARVPERGLLVKQAGEVRADPVTGQLTTVVSGLPPVPYSSFDLRLREGARGALIAPQTCGNFQTIAKLYPYSSPAAPVTQIAPFTVSARCAGTIAALPAHPTLSAGTTNPLAGAFAPFLIKVSREDGEARFGALNITLPKGITGKLAGVPYCQEAQIAAAKAREVEGAGALEIASPSCPSASQVGVVNVAAGAGPTPYTVTGRAYLAGPYKGAPLSMVIITPAVAGPFDLGAVVARAALYVNESTAEITAKSDPIPTILQGIPLDVRSISVQVNRDQFALNPTSCEAKAVSGQIITTTGAVAPLTNRFQVGGCKGLDFSPQLALSLKGATKRTGHPAFKAVLTQARGQANIGRTSVALPPTEFIDPLHVANPCTRPQFAAHNCPAASILGKATAYSPLLDAPLSGKVYFRSNGGERALPDVVADLNGQVHLVVVGQVDALHKKGSEESRVRTTFATVPDAPVSKFVLELKGGKKHGLLVNSANICKTPNKAIVKMSGQNGKTHDSEPKIATSCKG